MCSSPPRRRGHAPSLNTRVRDLSLALASIASTPPRHRQRHNGEPCGAHHSDRDLAGTRRIAGPQAGSTAAGHQALTTLAALAAAMLMAAFGAFFAVRRSG